MFPKSVAHKSEGFLADLQIIILKLAGFMATHKRTTRLTTQEMWKLKMT